MLVNSSASPCFKGYVGKNLKKMVKEGNSYDKDKKERNNDILYMMEERMKRSYADNTVLDLIQDENGSRIVLTNPVLNKITEKTNQPNKEVVVLDITEGNDKELNKSKIADNLEESHKILASYSSWNVEEILLDGITNITKSYVDFLDKIYGGNHNSVYKTLRKELNQYNIPGRPELNKLNIIEGKEQIETFKPTHTIDDIVF